MRLTAAAAGVTEGCSAGGLFLSWSGPSQYLPVHQELVSFGSADCWVCHCHTGQSLSYSHLSIPVLGVIITITCSILSCWVRHCHTGQSSSYSHLYVPVCECNICTQSLGVIIIAQLTARVVTYLYLSVIIRVTHTHKTCTWNLHRIERSSLSGTREFRSHASVQVSWACVTPIIEIFCCTSCLLSIEHWSILCMKHAWTWQ